MSSEKVFLHLVTVGTSVVRNAERCTDIDEDVRKRLLAWAAARPDSGEDVEAGNQAYPASREFQAVMKCLTSDPRRYSAELNAFIGYLQRLAQQGVKGVNHIITLFSTDTGVGWFSARVIEEYLKSFVDTDLFTTWGVEGHRIAEVRPPIRVENLGRDFSEGMINLVAKVRSEVERFRQDVGKRIGFENVRIVANLTGGFKPESGALLAIAGLIGIDSVYYIHEVFRDVVELPILPLRIDPAAEQLLLNALNDRVGDLEKRLLDRLGLSLEKGKLSPWSKKLLKAFLGR
ncbi:MAG TPA: putative CRISPR-associated protein [Ignisphaera aggregans]|uniref:Putative CRISPR-associated protein n=1 Tax=Ignisphaera aggregans TaxID=334771 RepID=A0A832YZ89_9CREN|nr:putative CRISPR-associated protein [Ignisphaera aggregans]